MMLPIMPWCRIDRVYQVGDITIYPYRGRLGGVDDVVEQRLARVLGTYRDIEGRPVDHAAVILECFRRALDWARRQGALWWELGSATSLARLYHRRPAMP